MELLQEVNTTGTTIMLVTHDIKVASRSERVLFMLDGRITAEKRLGKPEGNGEDARAREQALTAWLIEQGL
jgi:putative ABC transport system ATP-binding protein